MIFKNWEPIYKEIISDFSFSEHNDTISAELLNSLLQKHQNFNSLSFLSTRIRNKTVIIIGAGSQVSEIITRHKKIIENNNNYIHSRKWILLFLFIMEISFSAHRSFFLFLSKFLFFGHENFPIGP